MQKKQNSGVLITHHFSFPPVSPRMVLEDSQNGIKWPPEWMGYYNAHIIIVAIRNTAVIGSETMQDRINNKKQWCFCRSPVERAHRALGWARPSRGARGQGGSLPRPPSEARALLAKPTCSTSPPQPHHITSTPQHSAWHHITPHHITSNRVNVSGVLL